MQLKILRLLFLIIAGVDAAPTSLPGCDGGGSLSSSPSNTTSAADAVLTTYTITEFYESLLSTTPYFTVLPTTIVWTAPVVVPSTTTGAMGSLPTCDCPVYTSDSSAVSLITYTITLSYGTTMSSSPYTTVLPSTIIWTQPVALPTSGSSSIPSDASSGSSLIPASSSAVPTSLPVTASNSSVLSPSSAVPSSTYTAVVSEWTTMASLPYTTVLRSTIVWTQPEALPTPVPIPGSAVSSSSCSCNVPAASSSASVPTYH